MAEIKKISTELQLLDKFLDTSGDAGTSGQILSSTATGINWIDGSAIPGVPGGSGTLRTIPMWTPDGNTLGNSVLTQDVANQNIGLGVTPETGMVTYVSQLRIGEQSALQGHTNGVGADSFTVVTTNWKFSTSGAQFINGTTSAPGYANIYQQQVGEHTFSCSTASGVAGGAITSRMQMVIKQTGNVGIGTTSPGTLHSASYGTTRLHVDGGTDRGQMIIEGDSFAGIVLSDNGATANQRVFATSVDDTKYTIKPLNDNGTSTAGGAAVTVLHGGNVGIGTTNPTEKLVVQDGKVLAGHTNARGYGFHDLSNYTYTANTGRLSLVSNGAEAVSIDSSQKVGIGVTSPATFLQVSGQGNRAGGNIQMGLSSQGADKWSYLTGTHYNSTSEPEGFALIGGYSDVDENRVVIGGDIWETNPATSIHFWTHSSSTHAQGGTEKMRIDSAGNVGIGAADASAYGKFLVSGTGLLINANATSGAATFQLYEGGQGRFAITTLNGSAGAKFELAGNEKMRIDSSGNVGIGKTTSLQSHRLSILKGSSNQQLGLYYDETHLTAIGTKSTGDLQIYAWNGSSYRNILLGVDGGAAGGSVGIGTITPGTINGVAFSSVGLHTKYSTLGRTITEGTSWGEYIMNHSGASANNRAKFIQSKDGNIFLGSYDDNGSQRVHVTVKNSGTVGIGTTLPGGKLDVDGNNFNTATTTRMFITDHGNNYNNGDLAATLTFRSRYWSGDDNTGASVSNIKHYKGGSNGNGGSDLAFETATTGGVQTEKLRIGAAGAIKFNAYNGTNNTGSPTHILGTDANGLIVKSTAGSSIGPWLPLAAGSGDPLTGDLYIAKASNQGELFFGTANANYKIFGGGNFGYMGYNTNGYHRFLIQGAEIMRIHSNSNVGIGTTLPNAKLEVTGDLEDNWAGRFENTNSGGYGILAKIAGTSANERIFEARVGSSAKMLITGEGNVGIGVTNPAYKLVVLEDGTAASNIGIDARATGAGTNNYAVWAQGSGASSTNFAFYGAVGTNAFLGNTGIGTDDPGAKLDVRGSGGGYLKFDTSGSNGSIKSDFNLQLYADPEDDNSSGYQNIQFFTAGTSEKMRIGYNGKVGIGTTNPIDKLSVNGGTGDATAQQPKIAVTRTSSTGNVLAGKMILTTKPNDTTNHGNLVFQVKTTASSGESSAYYTNAITIDGKNANVGIGTSSPTARLNVQGAANDGLAIMGVSTTATRGFLGLDASNHGQMQVISSAAGGGALIKSIGNSYLNGGNIGIGTTSPGAKLDVRGTGNFLGTAVSGAALVTIENNSGSTATSYGLLVKGGGNSASGKTFEVRDSSGNVDLIVKGNGNVGINNSSPNEKLSVRGNVELVGEGVGNCGVRYIKYNCPDEASYNVLGLTTSTANFITKVGINKTSPAVKLDVSDSIAGSGFTNGLARFENTIETSSGGAGVLNVANNYQGGFGTLIKFWFEESSIATINFNSSTNAVVYNTTSDYRLKEDLKPFNGLEIIDQIKTYNYKWKKADARGYGALAHELQEVFPDAVTGEKDGEDMQGVDYSTLVPVLIKSIQELKAEIELLKQK